MTTWMARDVRFLNRAIDVAKSNEYKWHMGAVIAKGNRFIVSAKNRLRNDPLITSKNASIHAEAAAVQAALSMREHLTGCTIYVARYSSNNTVRMARPCGKCISMLLRVGIRRMVYTNLYGLMSIEKVTEIP